MCAVVWPVSTSAHVPRSSTATDFPADRSRYAVVNPVMPPPTTTTSTSMSRSSFEKEGKDAESVQYGTVPTSKLECFAIHVRLKQTPRHTLRYGPAEETFG